MYALQKLIQVGRFVEGMHYLGDDLPLSFHALQIGDVLIADDYPFYGRQAGMNSGRGLEPAPGSVFALKPAATAIHSAAAGRQFTESIPKVGSIICVKQGSDRSSHKIFGAMAENAAKTL